MVRGCIKGAACAINAITCSCRSYIALAGKYSMVGGDFKPVKTLFTLVQLLHFGVVKYSTLWQAKLIKNVACNAMSLLCIEKKWCLFRIIEPMTVAINVNDLTSAHPPSTLHSCIS